MLQFEVGMGIFLQCRPHIMAHTGVGSRLLQVVCHLFFGHAHLDTMGFQFLHTMIRFTWVFQEDATLYKVTNVARFSAPLLPGETAMPSLRSAAVGKLLLCTKSTTCFTNPAKPGICCGGGSLASSPFNFLRAPCFVGCLFRSISIR